VIASLDAMLSVACVVNPYVDGLATLRDRSPDPAAVWQWCAVPGGDWEECPLELQVLLTEAEGLTVQRRMGSLCAGIDLKRGVWAISWSQHGVQVCYGDQGPFEVAFVHPDEPPTRCRHELGGMCWGHSGCWMTRLCRTSTWTLHPCSAVR
jgi:hypothetical protein